jgi:hypothetical protein
MMRLKALFFLFSTAFSTVFAQTSNDWIEYGQPYVKIPVGKDAIYRVSYAALQEAGFPIASTDPKRFQVFHRGVQQAILIAGEGDNVFDPSDYIEFYGRRNDGTLDEDLYADPALQPHDYHNLFSDTTAYFLTVGEADGKRMEVSNESSAGLTAVTFHYDEKLMLFTSTYSEGRHYGDGYIYQTTFDQGEGWMGPMLREVTPLTFESISGIQKGVSSAGKPVIEVVVTGRGSMTHAVDVYVGVSQRFLATVQVNGYSTVLSNYEVEWSDISGAGNFQIGFKVRAVDQPAARVSVNYVKLRYPQEPDLMGSASAKLKIASATKSLIQLANYQPGTRIFDISAHSNTKIISTTETSTLKAVVTGPDEASLFASSEFIPAKVMPVNFNPISSEDFDYVIITHSSLRTPALGYSDPVLAYADYRSSVPGGSHKPLILDIEDLYDQFNYGEKSPRAIFQLLEFFNQTTLPKYLFLIGKALELYYDPYRKPDQFADMKMLVPTAGLPASDLAFSAGLSGIANVPAVATGRLVAMKPEEVAAYLNKVQESEAKPFDDLRRKHVLHLSGGITSGEPLIFRSYLESFAYTAENSLLGGKVEAIAKQSTDLKRINVSEAINQGVGLVTFFGHSSPGSLDFDIGFATDPIMGYNNKGKYPVMLMNGCDAGGFFLHVKLFGEDWISAADKGAIGFIAHTSYGFVTSLRRYSGLFYQVGYAENAFINQGIGDVQKEVAKRHLSATGNGPVEVTQVQQMLLLGDPAVKLFGAAEPDYAVSDESSSIFSLNEEPITIASDSFAVRFVVKNFGLAQNVPLTVKVERTLGDRSVIDYDSTYDHVSYSDTLLFTIKDSPEGAPGWNTFKIVVDPNGAVDEIREDNNIAYVDYFIPENGTQNLFPQNFSIVNTPDVTLSFQHTDILSDTREFLVEIDTSNLFNSAIKKQFVVNAKVLARKDLVIQAEDSTVYYWRTKLANPTENESKEWTVSSFTYIQNGEEGWAQIEFPQFASNGTVGLFKDESSRQFKFAETATSVAIRTFNSGAGVPLDSFSIKIQNEEFHIRSKGYGCRDNTINLVAFDRHSTIPYLGVPLQWFNRAGRTCGREPWAINSFTPTELITGNNDDIIAYVNKIAPGDSVVLFSIGDAGFTSWPEAAKMKVSELGISLDQINNLIPGEAVVIFARKGSAPGTANIYKPQSGAPLSQVLSISKTVTGRYSSGEMKSVTVGPALSWGTINFRLSSVQSADSVKVDVIGLRSNGAEELLFNDINTPFDISSIDAEIFPALKLVFTTSDNVDLTPATLENWIVNYEPVSEGLIFFIGNREPISITEGQKWTGEYGYVNVSNKAFNSQIPVNYSITNHSSFVSSSSTIMIEAPEPGDTTSFIVEIDTYKHEGENDIEVFVNPFVLPEQYYQNNVFRLFKHLNVIGENFQPVLDVTFDGRYIENNEFVQSSPSIHINLWDENPYLLKTDTVGVEIKLAYPCGSEECSFSPVYFTRSDVTWSPATAEENFKVVFTPADLVAGKYTLEISASDMSGNQTSYEVSFMVSEESSAMTSDVFPNPVKQFANIEIVIPSVVPERVQLQFFSMKGLLVKQIDVSELAALHIGRNMITIEMNDENRSSIPGGMYVYRLTYFIEAQVTERRGKILVVR